MKNKDKKKLRRLHHLLRLNLFPVEKIQFPELSSPEKWNGFKGKMEYFEVIKLQFELGLTNDDILQLGRTLRQEKFEYRWEYNRKPITVRRDNKDVKVGSGGSHRNKIRYPKKCRKTAWKRFYKLFPHLKPD